MHKFANPARFMRLADKLLPWAAGVAFISFLAGLYYALINSPPDYQQGETVRIMYIHVPAAWMCMFVYTSIAVASAVSLIWKHPLADVAARASAPIGAGFTVIALITGMLWGKPMWGTWWVWDARLTSVLILLFLYLGYMAIWDALENQAVAARAAAILALVGFVNVPIIKFSVDWWNTLHQPASIMRADGISIHTSMLVPLFLMFVAFNAYYIVVLVWRMKAELALRKIRVMQQASASNTVASR